MLCNDYKTWRFGDLPPALPTSIPKLIIFVLKIFIEPMCNLLLILESQVKKSVLVRLKCDKEAIQKNGTVYPVILPCHIMDPLTSACERNIAHSDEKKTSFG